jgi:hypothetical protein
VSNKPKVETVEEFLARGGSIKKLPAGERARQPEVIKKTGPTGPATIISMEEADLFHGEVKKNSKPKKSKSSLKIDLDVLPEALRVKFINKLKEEADGESEEVQEDKESKE